MVVGLTGCTADPPREEGASAEAQTPVVTWETKTLAWGAGPEEVGLRAGAMELPADGPTSIAVGPSGDVLVLDRLNERLLAIGADGAVRVRASVARDAEHLAAGPDGATAAWSPLRAAVWIHGRDGTALGELSIPRVMRDVQRIELGASHVLHVVTAMQETWTLGSPGAPLDLAATLRTKREGAAFLPGGRGVAARRTASGDGEILVYRAPVPGSDEQPPVAWTHTVPGPLAAMRVIGTQENAICVRIERVTQQQAIAVEREALCVEAGTGEVLASRALGRPGLYTMHEDLAVGGNPPVLAFARPEAEGLAITRIALAARKAEVAR